MSKNLDLFPMPVETKDPNVTYTPGCFAGLFELDVLVAELPLEHKTCVMYGKELAVPRLECWFSDAGKPYRFGGRVEHPKPWPGCAVRLRNAVEERTGIAFDSCFVNYYRDEKDSIAWHADDDAWIGPEIASVSFGGVRRFVMHHKEYKELKREWSLGDGDLLVMHAGVQATWLHSIPRQKAPAKPRLNFTFRQTVPA